MYSVIKEKKDLHLSRKLIHVFYAAIWIVLSCIISYSNLRTSLFVVTILIICFDYFRLFSTKLNNFIMFFFAPVMRSSDVSSVSSFSYYSLGLSFVVFFFSKEIAIPTFFTIGLADPLASLMGNLFGKKKFLPNKSYVGSATCFFVGFFIYYSFFFNHGIVFALLMALSVFLAEILSDTGVDDNLLVPVITSLALYFFLQVI